MRTFPLILSLLVVHTTLIAAGEVLSYEHTYASNDRYRVVLVSRGDHKLCMQVIEHGGKVVWETQPSSSRIKVSLEHDRIVVLTKVYGSGIVSPGKEGPMRGGKVFTLTGEKVGDLPPSVHEGECVGPVFLANTKEGIAAYDLGATRELWRNDKLRMLWASMAGPGLLNIRWYDHTAEGYVNCLVDLRLGSIIYRVASGRDENVKILAVSDERIVTLRTITGLGWRGAWRSQLLDRQGKEVAEVRWEGMPVAAAFSPDGTKLAAGCATREEGADVTHCRYVLDVHTLDGKRLQRDTLLTADVEQLLDASIIFDSQYVRARLTRKKSVLVKKAK